MCNEFSTFTPLETMDRMKYKPCGWFDFQLNSTFLNWIWNSYCLFLVQPSVQIGKEAKLAILFIFCWSKCYGQHNGKSSNKPLNLCLQSQMHRTVVWQRFEKALFYFHWEPNAQDKWVIKFWSYSCYFYWDKCIGCLGLAIM